MTLSLRLSNRITFLIAGTFIAFFLASGVAQIISIPLLRTGGQRVSASIVPAEQEPPERGNTFTTRSGDDICRRNVFDSTQRPCGGTEEPPPPPDDTGETALCSTDADLVGTLAYTQGDQGLAFVRVGGRTEFAETGQTIEGLGQVQEIGWRSILVEMESGGRCVLDLYVDGATQVANARTGGGASSSTEPPRGQGSSLRALSESIEVVSASERRVPWSAIEVLMGNPRDLRRLARFRPHMDGGQMRGFRLYRIRDGSPLHRLGFESGDVVNEVNGIEMTSIDRPIQAYTSLGSERSFTINFTRDGRRRSMSINVI